MTVTMKNQIRKKIQISNTILIKVILTINYKIPKTIIKTILKTTLKTRQAISINR